ncbi:MAG: RNA polymerase sigma-70 factor (ECF subfamily) [Myxococcota bacterium]
MCIDHKRKAARSSSVDYDDALNHARNVAQPGSAIAESPFRDPAREMSANELRGELGRAMEGLSEKHRQVIVLREIEGLAYKEIAETLDVSVGTVMSRLHHARHNLQSALRRYLRRE